MKMPPQSLDQMHLHPGRLTILLRSFISPDAQLRLLIYYESMSELDWYEIRNNDEHTEKENLEQNKERDIPFVTLLNHFLIKKHEN